jgi:hypothetical protein
VAALAFGLGSTILPVSGQVTPGPSTMQSSSLKLARNYQGNDFFSGFGEFSVTLNSLHLAHQDQISKVSMTQREAMSSMSISLPGVVWRFVPTDSYVTESVARSEGLASVVDGKVIMRANSDDQASGRGRDSVRISSKDEWADGVYILDVNHMPVGCGSVGHLFTLVVPDYLLTNSGQHGGRWSVTDGPKEARSI